MSQSLGYLLSKLAVLDLIWPDLVQIWPKFGPNLGHLKICKFCHHLSGALEVVFTFKNINRNQILGQSDNQKLKFIRGEICWLQVPISFKEVGQHGLFLLPRASFYQYLTQNINSCPGIVFLWIRGKMIQAEPSVWSTSFPNFQQIKMHSTARQCSNMIVPKPPVLPKNLHCFADKQCKRTIWMSH